MKEIFTQRAFKIMFFLGVACFTFSLMSSSHREAPLIADDPLADNTDVYAFRSPTDQNKVVLIANYIPFQQPDGGPNYYHFGENIRYEIHIDNNVATPGDDITYRWTFKRTNEDPTTFFNIRLGKENLKTTYTLERSKGGGAFQPIVTNGVVPPYNVGPRSISSPVGLNAPNYETLMRNAITTASTGEKVFAGPVDDPFFVDAGGIFDLGDDPRTTGSRPQDVLLRKNVSTLALEVDISTLQKDGKPVSQAQNILDGDYVIGVWASASRQKMRVLNGDGTETHSGEWIQVSRLGMPLTNEAIIPIGLKDRWNSSTPYQDLDNIGIYGNFFYNPELALYMDDSKFGGAVPALKPLRIQSNALGIGQFDFRNGGNGAYNYKTGTSLSPAIAGTALDDAIFGKLLLPGPGKPRSIDIWPIFHTGVPNLRPYQLAVNKYGENPFNTGKPFINNFLPNGGDMLRLNMAVPVTPRNSPDFNSEGLIQAAVLGLADPRFNTNQNLQNIPNMDGFPNGRRLEDDVTRIELQAVGGVVLAAIGFPYDDFVAGRGQSEITPRLIAALTYKTGISRNDTTLRSAFPFEQAPWPGTFNYNCDFTMQTMPMTGSGAPVTNVPVLEKMGLSTPDMIASAYPNPLSNRSTVRYKIASASNVQILVSDAQGRPVRVLTNQKQSAGTYTVDWDATRVAKGVYFISVLKNGELKQTIRVVKGE